MLLRRSSTPPTILISLRDLIDDRAATVPVPVAIPISLVSPLVIFYIPPLFVCNSIHSLCTCFSLLAFYIPISFLTSHGIVIIISSPLSVAVVDSRLNPRSNSP